MHPKEAIYLFIGNASSCAGMSETDTQEAGMEARKGVRTRVL